MATLVRLELGDPESDYGSKVTVFLLDDGSRMLKIGYTEVMLNEMEWIAFLRICYAVTDVNMPRVENDFAPEQNAAKAHVLAQLNRKI